LPLPWTTTISENQDIMAASGDIDGTDGVEVIPMMSVRGGPGGLLHQPIHESLTLAALINGNFGIAQGTTVTNASKHDWEYIRGAVWNDGVRAYLDGDVLSLQYLQTRLQRTSKQV
jgi:hypothetical protein